MAKSSPDDRFHLDEPPPRVAGGRRRKSVRVPRSDLPAVGRRERLNRLLLAHDPETAAGSRAALVEEDFELLRLIAAESPIAGTPPAIRQHAIALLADRPTVENLNALEALARRGDDLYVRGAALAALGQTGLGMAAPVLADGLGARDPVEVAAAERGVAALGGALGEPALRAAFARERRKSVREGLERAVGGAGEGKGRTARAPKAQRPVPDES